MPAASGRQPLDRLEELGEEEDRPEHPEAEQQGRDVDRGEAAVAEQPDVEHGVVGSQLPGDEARPAPTAPATNEASTEVLVHPWALPRTRPSTMPNRPALTSADARPGRGAARSRGTRTASTRPAGRGPAPTGTLSQKMYCHDHPLVTAPPTSGPIATAVPPMAPQIPRAAFRRSGGTAALSRVSDRGMIIAPPGALEGPGRDQDRDARGQGGHRRGRGEHARCRATKMRRRPNRSPTAAAESNRTAKVRV